MLFAFGLFSPATRLAYHIGVVAFIGIGLLDQSIVPIPGSMDALVIVFTAKRPEWWWYYALWATLGTCIGGYVTYRLAQKGGKEALEKRIGKKRAEKAYRVFDRWGFWSLFIGAIAPPPVPIVPFLAAAGVMQYPKKHFLTAYATGRILRFGLVGWVTREYGKHIFSFFSRYYKPALYSLIALAIVGGAVGVWYYLRMRRRKQVEDGGRIAKPRAA